MLEEVALTIATDKEAVEVVEEVWELVGEGTDLTKEEETEIVEGMEEEEETEDDS